MAIYSKNFEEFENLTVLSRELLFYIQHLKENIIVAGFFSGWSFLIMLSTVYTDGIHTLIFKLALFLFVIILVFLIYICIQRVIAIRHFNHALAQLKEAEKAMDTHLDNLTNSRY